LRKLKNAVKKSEKIALFGGTFDPVHHGHLIIAQAVIEAAGLDRIIFVPSARPPHKNRDIMFSADDRFSMLSLALEGNPRFTLSDMEIKRKGPSYTIDTIREFKSGLPADTELFFMVGMDNLFEMETWKDPMDLIAECVILAADRACQKNTEIPSWLSGRVQRVMTPLIEISSSDIRRRLREGKSIRYLVPEAVNGMLEKILQGSPF
jgi:nicotinate-nucleotide adenylyltransferase